MFSNELIGGRIRVRREKLGLKQADVANAFQISPQAVRELETVPVKGKSQSVTM